MSNPTKPLFSVLEVNLDLIQKLFMYASSSLSRSVVSNLVRTLCYSLDSGIKSLHFTVLLGTESVCVCFLFFKTHLTCVCFYVPLFSWAKSQAWAMHVYACGQKATCWPYQHNSSSEILSASIFYRQSSKPQCTKSKHDGERYRESNHTTLWETTEILLPFLCFTMNTSKANSSIHCMVWMKHNSD